MTRTFRSPLAIALVTAGLLPLALVARADDPPKPAPAPEKPAEAPAAPAVPVEPEQPAAPEKAKEFTLKDLDGNERKLSEFAGKWVVLEWTNYGCPFVKKHYNPVPGATEGAPATPGNIPALQKKYAEKGVIWLSICSSGPGKEGHMTPAAWKEAVKERMASPTAVLLDEDGKVGKDYGAKNTPAVWIVDPKGFIAYTGAVDDQPKARANPAEATSYIAQALDAGLAGQPIPICVTKPYG
jgi:peroxiredoxin